MTGQLSDDWHFVATADELDEGDIIQADLEGHAIAVYNVDGTFYATDDTCTHAEASLAEGFVDGDVVECYLHQARFHIPTGKVVGPPAEEDLSTYPVKVVDGRIYVRVGGAGEKGIAAGGT
ncbi:MAG: non-heme iron oxygenase ferredoxin subunit [Alphaproteobacteria bacterium]